MSFYGEWLACGNPLEEQLYIKNFLEGTQESSAPLFNGNEEYLDAAYAVIKQTPLTDFFEIIERDFQLPTLNAACVPCFSSLEKGASRVNEILEFEPEGLTFDQLGYQLMNSKKQGAKKKIWRESSKAGNDNEFGLLQKKKFLHAGLPDNMGFVLNEVHVRTKTRCSKKVASPRSMHQNIVTLCFFRSCKILRNCAVSEKIHNDSTAHECSEFSVVHFK